jgi:WD40 repeat protein
MWSASTKHRVVSVAFSPDGRRVAVKLGGSEKSRSELEIHTVILWDVKTGERLQSWEENETSELEWAMLAFSPDGTRLVSGKINDDVMLVRDAATGERAYTIGQLSEGTIFGAGPFSWDVAWSPTGDRLAFGLLDHTVAIWDTVTGEQLRVMEGNVRWSQSLAFSPDGTLLASEMGTGKVIVWHEKTGKALHVMEASGNMARHTSYSVAFNPDGTLLASGWSGGTIILWDVETGEQMRELTGHTSTVFGVVFAPGGDTLISGSRNEIIMWDVKTSERLYTLESQ